MRARQAQPNTPGLVGRPIRIGAKTAKALPYSYAIPIISGQYDRSRWDMAQRALLLAYRRAGRVQDRRIGRAFCRRC